MPGPGGGSRGGGGGRGGFSGGSHGGGHSGGHSGGGRPAGGFGGGHPGGGFGGGPRPGGFGGPPMGGGWHYGPRRYRGGGCCGGMFGMIFVVLVLIVLVISMLFSAVGSVTVTTQQGGTVSYDEEQFQDYADSQYAAEFGSSSAYEDNLLITVLIDDDYYSYYYIAWVGDHIVTDINYMLGGDETELGQAMSQCINASSYKYSLDSNLAQVMESMTEQIKALGLESSFTCTENHTQVSSHLTNHTSLDLTESTVNDALATFTEETGIPVVIVVEDMDEVFGKTTSAGRVASVAVLVVVLVAGIFLVVKVVRRRKDEDNGTKDSRYHDFDDQY